MNINDLDPQKIVRTRSVYNQSVDSSKAGRRKNYTIEEAKLIITDYEKSNLNSHEYERENNLKRGVVLKQIARLKSLATC